MYWNWKIGGDEKSKDKKNKDAPSVGLLAGGGFPLAAIGSSFAFITKTLAGLHLETVLLVLCLSLPPIIS